jgi:hypothetical protein
MPSSSKLISSSSSTSSSSTSTSESSTITTKSSSSKRVRISEVAPSVVQDATAALSEEERNESWWTASEFAAAKDSVKKQCRGHRKARRYSDCLTDAYKTACCLAQEDENQHYENMVERKPPDQVSEVMFRLLFIFLLICFISSLLFLLLLLQLVLLYLLYTGFSSVVTRSRPSWLGRILE